MAKKIIRIILTLVGVAFGPAVVVGINEVLTFFGYIGMADIFLPWAVVLIYVTMGLAAAIIFFIFSPKLIDSFVAFIKLAETELAEMALPEIFFGVVGLIVGLVIAFLASTLTNVLAFSWLRFIINAV